MTEAIRFYEEGIGLPLKHKTDDWAEFNTGSTPFVLKGVNVESECSTGYSPLICFDVDDMDLVIQRVLPMGAHLDGAIQYPVHGKLAAIRSPDGHMIGLFEPAI
eukprot:CAMPEP_0117733820 /NCGR_PEP_ID=MMETSP0947-20121206/293_1 /TAXON_ID=44440 /ORGANISM="Chattonella subsalsa, Strain CCMP2191" /LENGTH=103 /DNA_ID=CAMNT_0005548455 /DNA_START=259 /DNA_END=570 /DNA_ORIENTATION=+